jgi:hypothetical protein
MTHLLARALATACCLATACSLSAKPADAVGNFPGAGAALIEPANMFEAQAARLIARAQRIKLAP